MKAALHLSLLLAGLLAFQGSLFAEVVQGHVQSINQQNNTLTVQRTDQPGAPEVSVRISDDAELQGIGSLEDLSVGDEVLISGDARAGIIQADSLGTAQAAAAAPSGGAEQPQAADGGQAEYQWTDKLTRGATNIVTSPLEIPRTISNKSAEEGVAVGWTGGLVGGVINGVVRLGAGLVEVVTSPFNWPNENKEAFLEPEYAWQGWERAGGGAEGQPAGGEGVGAQS